MHGTPKSCLFSNFSIKAFNPTLKSLRPAYLSSKSRRWADCRVYRSSSLNWCSFSELTTVSGQLRPKYNHAIHPAHPNCTWPRSSTNPYRLCARWRWIQRSIHYKNWPSRSRSNTLARTGALVYSHTGACPQAGFRGYFDRVAGRSLAYPRLALELEIWELALDCIESTASSYRFVGF